MPIFTCMSQNVVVDLYGKLWHLVQKSYQARNMDNFVKYLLATQETIPKILATSQLGEDYYDFFELGRFI